jgi:hypothetical protein
MCEAVRQRTGCKLRTLPTVWRPASNTLPQNWQVCLGIRLSAVILGHGRSGSPAGDESRIRAGRRCLWWHNRARGGSCAWAYPDVEQLACRLRPRASGRPASLGSSKPSVRCDRYIRARDAGDTGRFVPRSQVISLTEIRVALTLGGQGPSPDWCALEVVPPLAEAAEPRAWTAAPITLHPRARVQRPFPHSFISPRSTMKHSNRFVSAFHFVKDPSSSFVGSRPSSGAVL